MALILLEVLHASRRAQTGSRQGPLLRVRCEACGEEYRTHCWPNALHRRKNCASCRAKGYWERRKANEARPGVWGMRCEP